MDSVHRLAKFQILVRSLFKWGVANEVLVRLPKYGTEYSLPAKRKFRLAEADREQKNGKLLFEPAEVKALLEKCVNANMRAMILLALNGGYGQEDLASLPLQVIDLDGGVIDYRRSKTGMRRRVVLWPETVKAVRSAIPNAEHESQRGELHVDAGAGILSLPKYLYQCLDGLLVYLRCEPGRSEDFKALASVPYHGSFCWLALPSRCMDVSQQPFERRHSEPLGEAKPMLLEIGRC